MTLLEVVFVAFGFCSRLWVSVKLQIVLSTEQFLKTGGFSLTGAAAGLSPCGVGEWATELGDRLEFKRPIFLIRCFLWWDQQVSCPLLGISCYWNLGPGCQCPNVLVLGCWCPGQGPEVGAAPSQHPHVERCTGLGPGNCFQPCSACDGICDLGSSLTWPLFFYIICH